jgi:hypothetical protein
VLIVFSANTELWINISKPPLQVSIPTFTEPIKSSSKDYFKFLGIKGMNGSSAVILL